MADRILLIDDDPSLQDVMAFHLAQEGYAHVCTLSSAPKLCATTIGESERNRHA